MSKPWKPSVTVAAIIFRDNKFLMVEEETSEGIRYNQPAGHLEEGESLEQAVVRETLEETAYEFIPTALIGSYLARSKLVTGEQSTFLRFAFSGQLGEFKNTPLDQGILRTVWMTHAEVLASQSQHRSPLVLQCVHDYLHGNRAPLSMIFTHPSALGK